MNDRNLITMVLSLVGILLLLAFADFAHSHEFYSLRCCNNKDCKPAARGSVRPVEGGFLVQKQWLMSKSEVVPYGSPQLEDAPDGDYHICLRLYGKKRGTVRCLYKPELGF